MAIRWYAGRHVRVSSAYVWPRRGGEAHVARNRATTRVTHTHGARVSRVRNEFEGCAGCVRIAMVGHVCTRGSSSLPLGSLSSGAIVAYVENDTFRNCAASLCEGTCRERAQSHAWYTRVNGCRGIRGGKREVEARASINEATLNNRSLISLIIRRDTPFSDQVSCSILLLSLPLLCAVESGPRNKFLRVFWSNVYKRVWRLSTIDRISFHTGKCVYVSRVRVKKDRLALRNVSLG